MMTNAQFDAKVDAVWESFGKRNSVNQLYKAIEQRKKYLAETTEEAIKATAINVTKSLRASTGTVGKNPTIIDSRYGVEITDTNYNPGWASPPLKGGKNCQGKHKGRRVVRMGGSGAIDTSSNGNRIINLAGAYRHVGEPAVKAYRLKISSTDSGKTWYDSVCLSLSKDDVFKFAHKMIVRHIAQYRGVSKRLLTIAMGKMSGSNAGAAAANMAMPTNSKPLPTSVMSALAVVNKSSSGYGSGRFAIEFIDNLKNSALALKGGPSDVDRAVQKAANATVAYINRVGNADLAIPFPERTKKAG